MLNPDLKASSQRPYNDTGRRAVADEADAEEAGEGREARRAGDGMASSDLFCQIKFNDEDMAVQAVDVVLVSPVHSSHCERDTAHERSCLRSPQQIFAAVWSM